METKEVKAVATKKETKKQVINLFADYDTTATLITTPVCKSINAYVDGMDLDAEQLAAVTRTIIARVKAIAKKPENVVYKMVDDNYTKWVDTAVEAIKERREAKEREIQALISYASKNVDYYVAYSVTCAETGGLIIAKRGNALPMKACADQPFCERLIKGVTKAKRERKDKDTKEPITRQQYDEKPLYVSIVHMIAGNEPNNYTASEIYCRVEFDGSLTLLKDAFFGKRINVQRGVIDAHNGLLKGRG